MISYRCGGILKPQADLTCSILDGVHHFMGKPVAVKLHTDNGFIYAERTPQETCFKTYYAQYHQYDDR